MANCSNQALNAQMKQMDNYGKHSSVQLLYRDWILRLHTGSLAYWELYWTGSLHCNEHEEVLAALFQLLLPPTSEGSLIIIGRQKLFISNYLSSHIGMVNGLHKPFDNKSIMKGAWPIQIPVCTFIATSQIKCLLAK